MDNRALKHICLWIVLLLLFILLLYGVHQFFFPRMRSRAINKIPLIEPAMKNTSTKKTTELKGIQFSFYSEDK